MILLLDPFHIHTKHETMGKYDVLYKFMLTQYFLHMEKYNIGNSWCIEIVIIAY